MASLPGTSRVFLVVLWLAGMFLLTACPASNETSGVATTVADNLALVRVSGREFIPGIIVIARGTTVQWTNHGGDAHTVTSGDGLFTGTLTPVTGSFNYTFNQTGDFEYRCEVFDYHVMTGRVVVR